jgi:prevent-host-death family protein
MESLLETTMRTLTIGEFKAQFSDVLTAVQAGESVIVCYGRKKQRVAALVPYAEFAARAGKRPLGLLKGKGGFSLAEDFALSDDEFLAA